METLVYAGLASAIAVPDPTRQKVIITCRALCERLIGYHTIFSPAERWKAVPPPSEGLVFDYRWFYEQKAQERLKLVAAQYDRCWLCSHENPVQRELFSAALMKMFLDECLQEESLFKRLHDRLLLVF